MKKIVIVIAGSLASIPVLSQNNVGIGTNTPQGKLHVNINTLASAQYIGGVVSVFENGNAASNSFLQLMNASTRSFSIGSGTELAFYRSGITFQADSSLTFEAGGFTQRMKIDKFGRVTIPNQLGIGLTDPQSRLHVGIGTVTNAKYIGGAISVFENANPSPAFFQLMNPSTQAFSIASGTDVSFYRSGISFQADSSLTFEAGGFNQRMRIDKFGKITIPNQLGIGLTDPQSRLHVGIGTVTNAKYIGGAISVFENANPSPAFLQLMNPSAQDFSIGSGTDISFYRSGITFQSDSSLTFETGGFIQHMKIDKFGSATISNELGIGNTDPQSRLHVSSGTIINAKYIGGSSALFENSSPGTSFIQLMNPSTSVVSIGSGTELSFYRSGISFQADSSVTVETGGALQRMKIDKAGVVSIPNSLGIGTTTPGANLDVSGTAVIGVNGTALTEIIKLTVNKNVANVPANSSITEIFTVANAQTGSTVYISPASALNNGLVIGYARVFPANNVEVRFTNVTVASIDPAAMDFYITVIR